jgi:hypothetical protein
MQSRTLAAAVLVALVLLGLAPRRAAADAWTVERLMAGLREVATSRAHFVERKYLRVLNQPLKTSGTLAYVAPDKLEKVTLEPKHERLAVEGDQMTMEPGPDGRSRILALHEHPEILAFLESIRATLAGDLATLSRFYAARVEGDEADWRLLLEPKDAKMRELVKWIRIAGSKRSIYTIDTEEADGDRSEMIIIEDPR